jgi:hypothetical protein
MVCTVSTYTPFLIYDNHTNHIVGANPCVRPHEEQNTFNYETNLLNIVHQMNDSQKQALLIYAQRIADLPTTNG